MYPWPRRGPMPCVHVLFGPTLTGLGKKDGGVGPIAVIGCVLGRLATK